MKRILKILASVLITLYFAAGLFFCLVAGAPMEKERGIPYIILAAVVSLVLPAFLCACLHYISYLQKKLEEKEKEILSRGDE